METKFYQCPICGNIVMKIKDSGVTPHCCGKEMNLLIPGMTDASLEKHVPHLICQDEGVCTVEVGVEPHPMTQAHHICFICLETEHGIALRDLKSEGGLAREAQATFHTDGDTINAAYELCNLHGLWKLNVKDGTHKSACGSPKSAGARHCGLKSCL